MNDRYTETRKILLRKLARLRVQVARETMSICKQRGFISARRIPRTFKAAQTDLMSYLYHTTPESIETRIQHMRQVLADLQADKANSVMVWLASQRVERLKSFMEMKRIMMLLEAGKQHRDFVMAKLSLSS